MIASGTVLTSLTLIAGVLTSGLSAAGVSRERQSATGLANQAVEEARALPMATLASGMSSLDLAATAGTSDPSIAANKNGTCSSSGSNYCFNGEVVKYTTYTQAPGAPQTNNNPLIPQHMNSFKVGPTTYTVSAYLTDYQNSTTSGTYRFTVVVTWKSALANGTTKSVQAQTIMYAPAIPGAGCNDPTVHPIPGPCKAGFKADAIRTAGTERITGTVGAITLDHATLSTTMATSNASVEQITDVKGVAQAAGAEIQAAGGPLMTAAGSSVSSEADSNPPAVTAYDAETLPATVANTASLTADANGNSMSVSVGAGDSGKTTSAIAANTPSANCPNLTTYPSPYTGNETDGLPCGGSQALAGSTTSATANLQTLGATTLASIVGSGNLTTAITDLNTAPATGRCTSTSGDGCARAQLNRAGATLSVGALPSNWTTKPLGWLANTYFAQITGLSDNATAEAGVGTSNPAAAQTAGSVTVYCATGILGNLLCPVSGLVTKTFSQITSQVTTPTMTLTDATIGGGTTITMSATVTPPSVSTSSSCSGTCTRTYASATSTPPTVSVSYAIVMGGQTVLNTTIVIDPGAIKASASYVPAST
jgi:hypothetical protein